MITVPKILFAALLVVAGLSQHSLAQTKEINISDVRKMEQNAMTLLRSIPHRSIWTSWVYPEPGKPHSYKTVLTREIDDAGRTRSIQENEGDSPFKRMEVISLYGKTYRKTDNNPWQLLEPLPPPPPPAIEPPPLPASKPQFVVTVRLVETTNSKHGTVTEYEMVTKMTREVDGKNETQITTNRYWFQHDGKLLRKDGQLERVGEPRILKNSMFYEYDNIRIDEPVLR